MDFEFIIPLSREDLLEPENNNYIVNDVCPPSELPGKIQDCQSAQKEEGAFFIIKRFDVLYSVLHHFDKINSELRETAWELVFSGVAQHGSELCLLLDDSNDLDSETKRCHVNILKMLTYLLCQITELCEAEATKPSTETVVNAGKAKRKQASKKICDDEAGTWDWDEYRDKCIHCLSQLCMLPLKKLFDPPVVEDEFVNLICNCCYKLLENPVVGRSKTTKDSIFQLLGIHIKKYNHSTSCTLKIIQLLRHFDHLVSPLAYGVGIFVNNYGAKTIINDIIREIGYMDDNDLARDNSETRSFSQFLVEIAQQMPTLVLPSISLLLPHLNGDAYSMRNCVLEVMGEIVLKVLSNEKLDEKSRNLRNNFLDKLEDHIHDINAFVRCKTIQIWNKLCTEKVIPLPRQQKILSLLVGRLEDKSSSVRKNSIQAVTTFLQSNPFAAKLSLQELKESLDCEKKKLEELSVVPSSEDFDIDGRPEETWTAIEPQIISLLEEILQEQSEAESQSSDLSEDSLLTEVLKQIKHHLKENQLRDGLKLLQKAINMWPDYSLFNSEPRKEVNTGNDHNEEDEKSENVAETTTEECESVTSSSKKPISELIDILKSIYLGRTADQQSVETNPAQNEANLQEVTEKIMHEVSQELEKSQDELVVGGIVLNELSRQQIFVQYLEVNNSDVDYEPMESDNETIDSYESDDVDLSEHEDDGVMLSDSWKRISDTFSDCRPNSLPELVRNFSGVNPALNCNANNSVLDCFKKFITNDVIDCILFANQVHRAIPIVCQLLGSKTNSDVLEAIEFFVTAFEFGVHIALTGIRKMLLLIWSKEIGIKEAIVGAYRRLYLNSEGQNERAKALGIVKNLTHLMEDLTLGESTSLEELIAEFMKSKDLSKQVIQVLWEMFSLKLPNTTESDSSAALQLLSMAARAFYLTKPDNFPGDFTFICGGHRAESRANLGMPVSRSQTEAEVAIIGSNIDVLITMGLGSRAYEDFSLVRDTCTAFLKLSIPVKTESKQEPVRFPENHDIFLKLSDILVEGVSKTEDPNYIPMAEQAITTIYKLAEKPDYICGDIIKRLAAVALSKDCKPDSEEVELPSSSASQELLSSEVLSRIVFLVGQVALNQLIHLELNISCELKRRHFMQEENANQKRKRKSYFATRPSLSVVTPRNKDKAGGETMEEEMGLTGAIADDAEAEYLRKVCDSDIVTGTNLLSLIAPLIIHVCSNPTKFKCLKLRAAAVLALAKFMLVSTEFCEKYLPLLFTILEKSAEPLIRANAIIALGDLSFRFPNLVEPWTPHLYHRLRDESVHVRKNTLMVLTHLILNDMVKVKGQISDMGVCIIDADYRISGLAKLFFTELSQKGNTVYNILPDIISRLSDPDCGVNEENFKTILEYLFSFIQKDRQVECLIEKLCHRFRSTRTTRQWRDIAFCLSLLTYGERCIKKLQENFTCYSDKFGEEFVYNCFVTILVGAKKLAKIDSKVLLDELEEKIEEARQKAVGENQLLEKAQIAKSGGVIKEEPKDGQDCSAPDSSKDPKTVSQVKDQASENNEDLATSDNEDFQPIKKRQSHFASSRKSKQVVFDSDVEADSDQSVLSK
ncbi:Condensin complex subunit 1 [Nymphon striatum]|nr:Condensin complex subunit 1 [Nymphon striatum]